MSDGEVNEVGSSVAARTTEPQKTVPSVSHGLGQSAVEERQGWQPTSLTFTAIGKALWLLGEGRLAGWSPRKVAEVVEAAREEYEGLRGYGSEGGRG